MYCIRCDKDGSKEDKFCFMCGHKMISSKKEWEGWRNRFSEYSKDRLQEMITNSSEYQEDAVVAAEYLFENYTEDINEDEYNAETNRRSIEWFYVQNGDRKGPLAESELIQLFANESIDEKTQVWTQGFTNWVPLNQSGIVLPMRDATAPPPINVSQMNNKSIIFLLFVPILSTLIQFLIAGWFQVDVIKLWWVAYGLNIICCTIDYYMVKRAGYNADKLMAAFLFLIPLYIYKRMALVNGKKWLLTIIWTAVFVLDILIPDTFWVKTVNMSNPSMISCVKDGSFYNYEDTTVGQIFDRGLEESSWRTYMGADRRILVQVKGKVDGYKLDTVFELNMDRSFEVSSMSLGGEFCDNSQINSVIAYLYKNSN